ncbi:MAG: XRE family transcriptional regulator [Burkholderiaceae bacterium]
MSSEATVTPPRVGGAVKALRRRARLTLDQIAKDSGVSKSVLSQIENDQTNPTIATLWRLCRALGVNIEDLLRAEPADPGIRITPVHGTLRFTTPDEKCLVSILGPVDQAGAVEWYTMDFESEGALESQPHAAGTQEHLTVLEGGVTVESGSYHGKVRRGETARYRGDQAHAIRNPHARKAKVLVVVTYRPAHVSAR